MIDNPAKPVLNMAEILRSGSLFTFDEHGAPLPRTISSVSSVPESTISYTVSRLQELAAHTAAGPLERSVLYAYTKAVLKSRRISRELKQETQKASDVAYALMSGGSLTQDDVTTHRTGNSQFWKFMKVNNLFHAHNSFSFHPERRGQLLIVNGRTVDFTDLTQEVTEDGIRFKLGDETLFETDSKLTFKKCYYAGLSGIQRVREGTNHRVGKDMHKPSHRATVPSGKYKVLVMSSTVSHDGRGVVGDHAYLGIEAPNGERTFYGKFGKYEFMTDPKWALGHAPCEYRAADTFTQIPLTNAQITMTPIEVSEENARRLRRNLEGIMTDKAARLSYLQDNCSEFVERALKSIDIEIDCKTTALAELNRIIFTDSYRSLPGGLQVVLNVLLYPICVGVGILLWVVANVTEDTGYTPDVNLVDVFAPWAWQIRQPVALRRWQLEQVGTRRLS